ncbi:MAG: RNA methyltransferase RsmF [Barnesiella sp.]|nr:RNA methyltransferase RsmF [Barnesiella sp.]
MTPLRSIPDGFAEACAAQLGVEASPMLEALREGEPSRSVRLNPSKPSALSPSGEAVEWCDSGVRLDADAPSVTLDPLFHAGAYYAQDASSMIVSTIVKRIVSGDSPLVVVDACAAPGGKTTAAIDSLPDGSLMIANEIVPVRCAVLRENIMKWGYPATVVTRGDTAALARLGETADLIIADVPCSGEGMMRKDADAIAQWTPRLVEECARLQREIIDNLWKLLRPGGTMIYSTCTFNRHENEENLAYIVDELGGVPRDVAGLPSCIAPGIDTPYPCYRFMPHRLRGEGLFVAVVTKQGYSAPHTLDADTSASSRKKSARSRKQHEAASGQACATAAQWLDYRLPLTLTAGADTLTAFPEVWMPLLRRIERVTTVVQAGVTVAQIKGRDIIPHHALAMSAAMSPHAFTQVELSLDDARDYLRRNTLTLPPDTPRGYVAVTYGGLTLGFMKHLGNRSNNLYPAEYRIKFL